VLETSSFEMLKIKIQTNTFCNHLCRNWKLVETGAKARKVNGILGGLCREHYPGLVEVSPDMFEPATQFDHYELAADAMDRSGHRYRNKAERVVRDLSVSLSGTHCILLATDTSYSFCILLIIN